MAGLSVPQSTLEKATRFLNANAADSIGSRYGCRGPTEPFRNSTAIGLFCRQRLGWGRENPGLVKGVEYLKNNPPTPQFKGVFYCYYATQVMRDMGGDDWTYWNSRMRDFLIQAQEKEGGEDKGSWSPQGWVGLENSEFRGGRFVLTSYAILTLEVYYRHYPLWMTRKPISPPPPPPTGTIILEVEPQQAEVYLDEEMVRLVAQREEALIVAPGKHTIAVRKQGFHDDVRQIDVAQGQVQRIPPIVLKPQTQPTTPLGKRLAGTRWVNTNGDPIECDSEGTIKYGGRERRYAVLDDNRLQIFFPKKRVDTLVFDKQFTVFDQYSTLAASPKRPLYTGKRLNREAPLPRDKVAALLGLLKDKDAQVRRDAAVSLAGATAKETAPALINAAVKDSDAGVRRVALFALLALKESAPTRRCSCLH